MANYLLLPTNSDTSLRCCVTSTARRGTASHAQFPNYEEPAAVPAVAARAVANAVPADAGPVPVPATDLKEPAHAVAKAARSTRSKKGATVRITNAAPASALADARSFGLASPFLCALLDSLDSAVPIDAQRLAQAGFPNSRQDMMELAPMIANKGEGLQYIYDRLVPHVMSLAQWGMVCATVVRWWNGVNNTGSVQ